MVVQVEWCSWWRWSGGGDAHGGGGVVVVVQVEWCAWGRWSGGGGAGGMVLMVEVE